jgi:polyhydroxybutyrate depolymerase
MKRRNKKIILWVLGILIGLPLAFIGTVLAWGFISDKTNGAIVSSGITRRYLLYVPKTYDRSKPTPLVISIHPAATWGAFEKNITGWNDVADEYGFIVVYPNGSGAFFDGFGPGQHVWPMGPRSLPRDVRFVSDLIDKLEAQYNIDPNRIYANGMSNGGGMAFALSCELADRIAAVGAVAAAHMGSWSCRDSRPMPTIAFHGTSDRFAPYLGGSSPIAPRPFANIPDWTAQVAHRNRCQSDPIETRISASVRRLGYGNCAANADAILYTIEGGGHSWPGGRHLAEWIAGPTTDEISASRIMWEFYVDHPLRPPVIP